GEATGWPGGEATGGSVGRRPLSQNPADPPGATAEPDEAGTGLRRVRMSGQGSAGGWSSAAARTPSAACSTQKPAGGSGAPPGGAAPRAAQAAANSPGTVP